MEETSKQEPTQTVGSEKKKRALVAGAALAAAVGAGIVAFLFFSGGDGWLDPSAKAGGYAGKSHEEIVSDLNATVKENEMNLSVASVITGREGSDEATVRFENIEANHVDQKMTLTLDDTGEVLWQSGAIEPGQSIDTAKLSRSLEPGSYSATALVTGYDRQTHAERGKLAGAVTIYIAAKR